VLLNATLAEQELGLPGSGGSSSCSTSALRCISVAETSRLPGGCGRCRRRGGNPGAGGKPEGGASNHQRNYQCDPAATFHRVGLVGRHFGLAVNHRTDQVLAAHAVQDDSQNMQRQQGVDQLLGGTMPATEQAAGVTGDQAAERAVEGHIVVAEQAGDGLKGHQAK